MAVDEPWNHLSDLYVAEFMQHPIVPARIPGVRNVLALGAHRPPRLKAFTGTFTTMNAPLECCRHPPMLSFLGDTTHETAPLHR
jgi:hypothetical protein